MSEAQPSRTDRKPGEFVRITGGLTMGSLWVWNGHDWSNLVVGGMMYVLRQQASVVNDAIAAAQSEASQ